MNAPICDSYGLATSVGPPSGGAGGANATASGGNSLSALISPHELGHSLGGLQGEYDYYQRGVRGDCYSGGEPSSAHHTLLTVEEMLTQQRKWWRWLGEPSEAGGLIDRFEGRPQPEAQYTAFGDDHRCAPAPTARC